MIINVCVRVCACRSMQMCFAAWQPCSVHAKRVCLSAQIEIRQELIRAGPSISHQARIYLQALHRLEPWPRINMDPSRKELGSHLFTQISWTFCLFKSPVRLLQTSSCPRPMEGPKTSNNTHVQNIKLNWPGNQRLGYVDPLSSF